MIFFILLNLPIVKPRKVSLDYLIKTGYSVYSPSDFSIYTTKGDTSDNWNFIGPMPIEKEGWSSNQPASGRVTAILIHPEEEGLIYIGGAQGGIWRSYDDGKTWEPITDHLSSLATGHICFDPSNYNIIYYGTGEQHFSGDSYFGDGLFKSMDGGDSWVKLAGKDVVGAYISRVGVDGDSGNIVHLTSDKGYLRSSDSGKTWEVKISSGWGTDLLINPENPEVVYVAIRGDGIYRSEDRGNSWDKLTNGLPSSGFQRINMAISPSQPSVIYASFVAKDGSLYGMYKTTDGGDSWVELSNTPNYLGYQGWYDNCLAVDPHDPDICYAGGVYPYDSNYHGVIKTTDGGRTWSDITIGVDGIGIHPDQHYIAISPDGDVYVGNDGGIWKTEDGGAHWIDLNHTLGITQFYTVDVYPDSSQIVIGGTQDNGTLLYKGSISWRQVAGGDGGPVAFEKASPYIFYATYVFLSPMWKFINEVYYGAVTGPWKNDRRGWTDSPIETHPSIPHIVYVGTHRVWKTLDSGTGWNTISDDLTKGSGYISSIAISDSDPKVIYTGSTDGKVYRTKNGGNVWEDVTPSELGTSYISGVVVSPVNPDEVFIAIKTSTGKRIFRTTSGGEDWQDITGNFPENLRILSIECAFLEEGVKIFLGTDYGVYLSSDTGKTYTIMGTGLPSVAIYDMEYTDHDSTLTVATHGRGMWQIKVKGNLGIKERRREVSSIYDLKDKRVYLYDIMGNKRYIPYFNEEYTKNLPPGIYFLRGMNQKKTVKFIIIR